MCELPGGPPGFTSRARTAETRRDLPEHDTGQRLDPCHQPHVTRLSWEAGYGSPPVMPSPRFGIAYTPPPSSPLARFGAEILGYDSFEGVEVPHQGLGRLDRAVLALATREPRRYGFHAALVSPFRINGCRQEDIVAAIDRFAWRHSPAAVGPLEVAALGNFVALVPLQDDPSVAAFAGACLKEFDRFAWRHPPAAVGPLEVAALGNFVALVPLQDDPSVAAFAGACLKEFDRFAAPLSPSEREERKADGLTERQLQLLHRWGDPYVLDQFRFRMVLAGPLPASEVALLAELLAGAFANLARDHVELDAISLLRQDNGDRRFRVAVRRRLTGE
jgi:Protein of unknown function (DUF1045)